MKPTARLTILAILSIGGLALWALLKTASPATSLPPLNVSELSNWWASRDPLGGISSIARVITIAALAYVMAALGLSLVSSLVLPRRLQKRVQRVVPPALAGLVSIAVLGTGSAYAAHNDEPSENPVELAARVRSDPPTMRPLPEAAEETSAHDSGQTMPPTMRLLAPQNPTPSSAEPTGDPLPPTDSAPEMAPIIRTVTVEPGDHFWSIAERHVESQLNRSPNDAEIESFWNKLVSQNREHLMDPDNPDLIYPGQVLILPATLSDIQPGN